MRSYLILFSLFITNLLSAQTIRDATLIRLANGDTTFISQVSALRASITLDGEVNGATSATTVDTVRRIWFDRTYNQPDSLGKLQWDANEQTLQLGLGNTTLSTVLDVGQETLYPKVINNTSAIIKKGTPVMVDTVGVIQGDNIRVRPAIGSTARNVSTIMGVAVHDIGIGETGFVTWFGHVTEVNHTDIAQTGITLDTAQILYLSSTEPGKFTNVIPTAPNLKVPMAIVIRKPTANNMTLLVRPQLTPDIHDVNDVSISNPTAGQVLRYNSGGFWENGQVQAAGIANNSIDSTKIATGAISITDINQSNASPNQVLKWNGTQWAPAPDETASGSGATNLTFSENASPFKLNSDTGTDVTFAQGNGITLSRTNNELTVTNSAPDLTVAITGAGINTVTGTYPNFTVTGTEVDGSVSNEGILGVGAAGANTATITTNTSTGSAVTISGGGILAVTETTGTNGGTITLTATEVDGSVSNEGSLTVGAGTATTSLIQSNTSGSTNVTLSAGTGMSISESTNTITLTNAAPDQTVAITGTGITVGGTYPNFTLTAADQSATNEGRIGVGSGASNSATILTNTTGSNAVSIEGAGIIFITEAPNTNGGTITLTGTEVDGSVSNEGVLSVGAGTATTSLIQSNTSGSTNVTLEAGPNIFLSETGNTINIDAADTDLELSGSASPYFINSSTGSDVSIAQGNGITLSRSTNQLTITAVDQSATNELQDLSLSGQTLSITSGTGVTLPVVGVAASTGLTVSASSGTHTLALTGQALDLHNLSTNGILARVGTDNIEARSIQSGSGITVTNGDGVLGNISIAATDASVTNEGVLSVGAGTSGTSLIQSNTSGSNTVTLEAGSNITLTENTTTNTIIIASSGGGGTPAGSNFNVQFNNAGAFGAESVFTYDTTNNRLGVGVSVPVAALNSRTTLTAATALSFLAENNKGDDVIKVKNNGEIQLGNNEAIYPLFKQSTSATDTSFTGNGITFESQPAAGTSDLFSFYHPSSSISQTTNIIRQGGILTVTSGSSSYRGYIGNPTINVSGGTGDVDIINISPTVTQAAGGINMIDINPSVTAASGGLRGLYTNITSASNFYQIFADGTAVSRFDGNVGILTDPDAAARLHVNGVARVDATILSRGTGDVTGSTTSAALRLQNTTPTTGKTWFIGSKDNGTFELSSTDASNVITTDANSTVKIGFKLAIGDTSNVSPNSILGRNTTSGEVGTIKIGSGLSLASGTLSATGGGSGTVTTSGSPITNRLAKFTGSTEIGNSLISESGTSIGIDVTTPTAALHLKAGTATANTAPLKFTSGTINTTPEAGAMEYDGTNFYLTNGSGTRNVIGTSGGNFTPQVTEYASPTNTTLAIPSGATMVEIVCIGSGSGGGSGRRGSTTTARTGGGGGASGNFSITTIRVSDITSTPLLVTVGAGGAGGAAITTDDTNGIAGGTGNASQVTANNGTILCFAQGANAGGGGGREALAATGGTTRVGGDLTGAAGVSSSVNGGSGSAGTASNIKTPSGGGSAGGLSTSNNAANGGSGGTWNFGQVTQSNQGTTGNPNASNGGIPTQGQIVGGGGGGGGGSQAAAAGGNGGNGVRGGGGGGGAASSNGFNSGAGGAGGAGYVRVTFY